MEQVKDNVEIDERRQQVAAFIQASLALRDKYVVEAPEEEFDPELYVEAQDFEVREYQLDAWGALWDARQAGAKTGLINLATGLGKTSIGVFDVIRYREEYQDRRRQGPRILFASHKNEINEQAAERFASFIPDATQGFYNGDEKNRDGDITFATLQSLYNSLDTFKPGYFDYIIYDEAHHAQADTFKVVVEHFRPKFQLALTATPKRLDGLDIEELFGEPLYSKGLAQSLAEGLLADVDYHIVFDDAVKEAMQSGFEPKTLKALYELLDVKARNEVIVKNIREEKLRIGLEGAKTIVFCEDIDHVDEIAELLGGKAYHSYVNKGERKKLLNSFRNGDFDDICTRDMFNEGVDIPDARLIVFLRSTSSPTVFEQQLGRGLRKIKGKDKVTVLDFVANIERISMVRELVEAVGRKKPVDGSVGDGTITDIWPIDEDESTPEGGVKIHTNHGDFDFDRLTVHLLEKYNILKVNSVSKFEGLNREKIIELALSLKSDGPLTTRDIDSLSRAGLFLGSSTVITRFGTLTEFQRACGFEVKEMVRGTRGMTKEGLIARALELKPDSPLTNTEIKELAKKGEFVSDTTVRRFFGSTTAFQEACGFTATKPDWRTMSNDDIIMSALRLKTEGPLSTADMLRLNRSGEFPNSNFITERFGSIPAFQRACGFEPLDKRRMQTAETTEEEIVNLALEIKPEAPLTKREILKLSREGRFPHAQTIIVRFGSLLKFQKACGFDNPEDFRKKPKDYMTDEEIVARALELKPDDPLTAPEIDQLSKDKQFVGSSTICNRFGTIAAFQRACGFDVKVKSR